MTASLTRSPLQYRVFLNRLDTRGAQEFVLAYDEASAERIAIYQAGCCGEAMSGIRMTERSESLFPSTSPDAYEQRVRLAEAFAHDLDLVRVPAARAFHLLERLESPALRLAIGQFDALMKERESALVEHTLDDASVYLPNTKGKPVDLGVLHEHSKYVTGVAIGTANALRDVIQTRREAVAQKLLDQYPTIEIFCYAVGSAREGRPIVRRMLAEHENIVRAHVTPTLGCNDALVSVAAGGRPNVQQLLDIAHEDGIPIERYGDELCAGTARTPTPIFERRGQEMARSR